MRIEEDGAAFWEAHYKSKAGPSGGRPSAALVRFTEGRAPGRALDLGCARGDDAIWLAGQGWRVTGVDVSETALVAARDAAARRPASRTASASSGTTCPRPFRTAGSTS